MSVPAKRQVEPPSHPRRNVRFEDLIERLEAHGRDYDESRLRAIHDYAEAAHHGQKRRSGEPYLTHPLAVAWLLADLGFDATCVSIALLHDVLEDTGATREDLAKAVGEELAALVDGVSKIGQHEYVRRDQAQAETFRKLILASARDLRVILVKIADRLHNMQTLDHVPPEARRRIAQETLEIYGPLAHRLGMSRVKTELEDLAFYFLYPHQFAELESTAQGEGQVGRGLDAQDQRAPRRRVRALRPRRRDQLAGQGLLLDLPEAAAARHRAPAALRLPGLPHRHRRARATPTPRWA